MTKLFLLLLVIFLSVGGFLFWQRTTPLSYTARTNSPITRLLIPDLSIDVPVIPAKLEGTKWEYTTKGVAYLSSTPLPGDLGNSVFYGHNWPNLLGKLPKSKPGQKVIAMYADGSEKTFLINTTATVTPEHVEILKPTSDIRLTIFTCTGFLDQDRFVVTAIPL